MANTGIRQLTTVVGGYAKRIWYSLNGTTPTNELMSIDDTGKLKCVSEQVTGLAGTGSRMVVADSTGNLIANGEVTEILQARGTILANSSGLSGGGSSAYIKSFNAYSTPINPDYTFWYNDQTGVYHPSTDNLGISTGGVGRALFNSSGLTLPNLAGTGSRMVVADSTGNLSASMQIETGTWTPVLKASESGVAVAGASNAGRYTKIGKMIIFSADIDWTSISGTISGSRIIDGLPYTSASSGAHGSASHGDFTGLVCSTNRSLSLTVASSSEFIYLGENDLQTGGSYFQTITINSSGTILGINGCYYID
jgi:hypothetical protein